MEEPNTGIIGNINHWLARPFTTNGSALNWVLFVGLLILAVWWWNIILLAITKEV